MKCYIAGVVLLAVTVNHSRAESNCLLTKSAYERLNTGMTYEEAIRALGCEATQVSDTEVAGIRRLTYIWSGGEATSTSHISAIFEDGKLTRKDQSGLR